MPDASPVRVLHLIGGLGGGGSERWLRDVVRRSPPTIEHRVQTIYPSRMTDFTYAEDLRALGAYASRRDFSAPTPAVVRGLRTAWARGPRGLRGVARAGACIAALVRALVLARRFRPHVIHSHTLIDFSVGLIVSRAYRVPLVHTVPCLFSQMVDAGYGRMPAVYTRLHRWVACFSAGENHTELTGIGVPAAKIHYDLGGVDLEAVDAVHTRRESHAVAIRRQLGVAADCRLALSAGRLHASKGQVAGIRALRAIMHEVADLHLLILGAGPDRAALETEAARLDIRDRVHFLGFVKDPLPYYAACDVYFRTSRFELENLCFYLAMAMGLAVVGFDTGEGRDLVHTVGCGAQVGSFDVTSFAHAAACLLQSDDRGRALGGAGRAFARNHLDVTQSASRLADVYRQLAERHVFTRPPLLS